MNHCKGTKLFRKPIPEIDLLRKHCRPVTNKYIHRVSFLKLFGNVVYRNYRNNLQTSSLYMRLHVKIL